VESLLHRAQFNEDPPLWGGVCLRNKPPGKEGIASDHQGDKKVLLNKKYK
jgi:hypothetical protein